MTSGERICREDASCKSILQLPQRVFIHSSGPLR